MATIEGSLILLITGIILALISRVTKLDLNVRNVLISVGIIAIVIGLIGLVFTAGLVPI